MFTYLKRKYWKPTSLTWLASAAPLMAGLFIAFEPVHHMAELAQSVSTVFGNASPALLINGGLVGIGLRGAKE